MSKITEMVRDGKKARFTHYRDEELWYETECGFRFPVPISDTGGAAFVAEDKAIYLMRWIRLELERRSHERAGPDSLQGNQVSCCSA